MLCPFLTTDKEKVECFKECTFYEYEMNEGMCPFKNIVKRSNYKVFYDESYTDDEEIDKSNYIHEIYSKVQGY
ncbi:hypothetical protein ACER0A_006080 [Haloimpatiens sp. FM7315]|uniref:hypothetical protein n=1 Tax=Haloimpatiens sp. FM7315 TaxID=3298609 RepID=UPI0035A34C3C